MKQRTILNRSLKHQLRSLLLGILLVFVIFTSAVAEEPSTQETKPELTIQASSTLAHRQPGYYDVANLTDADLTTAWCEGKEDDDGGEEEWIEFTFSERRKIERIGIVGGYANSRSVYLSNNRVKTATLAMSGRELVKINLRDSQEMQFIELPPGNPTSILRITINEVFQGSRNHATCLSEILINPIKPGAVERDEHGITWVTIVPIDGVSTFMMGCAPNDLSCQMTEEPRHLVTLHSYQMMKSEVTVELYQQCAAAGQCLREGLNKNDRGSSSQCNWGKSGHVDHPINCVDWSHAQAFCEGG